MKNKNRFCSLSAGCSLVFKLREVVSVLRLKSVSLQVYETSAVVSCEAKQTEVWQGSLLLSERL